MFKMAGVEELTLLDPVVLPDFVCDFREINILLLVFLSVNNSGLHRRTCRRVVELDALCIGVCQKAKKNFTLASALPVLSFGNVTAFVSFVFLPDKNKILKMLFNTLK